MLVFSTIYESQYDRLCRAAIQAITMWYWIEPRHCRVFGVGGKAGVCGHSTAVKQIPLNVVH
jgi:hypothetical protein